MPAAKFLFIRLVKTEKSSDWRSVFKKCTGAPERQLVVQLHCGTLMRTAKSVCNLDVDLGTIECSPPGVDPARTPGPEMQEVGTIVRESE